MVIFHDGTRRFLGRGVDNLSYAVNEAGERVSIPDSIPSWCRYQFNEYVKRALSEPFPFDPKKPARREVADSWKDRKLRLVTIPGGNWKEGIV